MKTYKLQKTLSVFLIASFMIILVGCGASEGVVSSTRIGQLIGSDANSNLYYSTQTHSGSINSEGEFVYETGEHIKFFKGDTLIGTTEAAEEIPFLSLTGITVSAR